jgi:hypothetical protein
VNASRPNMKECSRSACTPRTLPPFLMDSPPSDALQMATARSKRTRPDIPARYCGRCMALAFIFHPCGAPRTPIPPQVASRPGALAPATIRSSARHQQWKTQECTALGTPNRIFFVTILLLNVNGQLRGFHLVFMHIAHTPAACESLFMPPGIPEEGMQPWL